MLPKMLQKTLQETLRQVQHQSIDALLQTRFNRVMEYGNYKEVEL